MAERRTITFQALHPDHDPSKPRWVAGLDSWTEDRGKALSFTLYAKPTNRERPRIDLRMADALDGGAAELSRLESSIRLHQQLIAQEIVSDLWPDGVPEGISTVDDPRFQQAWNEDTSDRKVALDRLTYTHTAISLAAAWPSLVVKVPPGWDSFFDAECEPEIEKAIVLAYLSARRELDEGNAHASD